MTTFTPGSAREILDPQAEMERQAQARREALTPFLLTGAERAHLADGLMLLMHQMEQVPENDLSELPELQALLKRLMEPG